MIKSRIIYIMLLIGACLFWVMYRGTLSLQLVIVALLLPVLLCLLLMWQKRTLTVRMEPTAKEVNANADFQILMRICTRCPIPIHHVSVMLRYSHSITQEEHSLSLHLPGMGSASQSIRLPFSVSCCGKIRFRLAEMKLYDPLSLFSFSISCKDAFSLLVLPPADVSPTLPTLLDTIIFEPGERFSQHCKGDDPSEIFSVDTYAEGDPLSRVHWKLTAKNDAMMIKQFSLPLHDKLVLFADYRRCGSDMISSMRLHHVLSLCVSMSQQLLREQKPHYLWWQPMEAESSDTFLVNTPEQLAFSLREMLSSVPYLQNTAAVFSLEQLCAAHLIYCTAFLDEKTVAFLSSLAMRCRILVLYICNAQPEKLPQDVGFLCCPVIIAEDTQTEVEQHGKETST